MANKTRARPATVMLDAPPNLDALFVRAGFDVHITLTRNGVIPPDAKDPGADPGPVNAPITSEERNVLQGALAAYDAAAGERAPQDEDEDE